MTRLVATLFGAGFGFGPAWAQLTDPERIRQMLLLGDHERLPRKRERISSIEATAPAAPRSLGRERAGRLRQKPQRRAPLGLVPLYLAARG